MFNGRDKLFFMTNYEGFRLRNQRGDALQRAVGCHAKRRFLPDQHGCSEIPCGTRRSRGTSFRRIASTPSRRRCSITTRRPTSPGTSLVNNYLAVNQNETNKNQFTTRVDWVENQKSTWYGRYSWTDESIFTGGIRLNGSSVATSAHQVVVDNARVLTNTLVNEVRVGYNNFFNHAGGELNNVYDPISQIGLKLPTPIPARCLGNCRASASPDSRGLATIPSRRSSISNANLQFIDNLSWTRGRHFLKFGGEVRFDNYDQDGNQFARGSAGFANNVATGNAFADYLLGYLNTWAYASGLAVAQASRNEPGVLHQPTRGRSGRA